METLTIVADFVVKPDKLEFAKAELKKLVQPTRAEEGCILYELHQNNVNQNHFVFYETWSTHDLWQQHMKSSHITAFLESTDGFFETVSIHEMSKLEN